MKSRGSNKKQAKKMSSRIKTALKIRCMFDCSANVDPNSVVNCTAPKGVNSAKVNDETNNNNHVQQASMFGKNDDDIYDEKQLVVAWKIGRNYSMGVGKIGRIDEDEPCDFKEIDVKRYFYPRCRSLAFGKQNLVY